MKRLAEIEETMPVELKIPAVGESISEVVIGAWHKSVGDAVEKDEDLVELETDKATFELPAPAAGVITQILKKAGDTATVGDVIGSIGEAAAPSRANPPAAPPAPAADKAAPAKAPAQDERQPTGKVQSA